MYFFLSCPHFSPRIKFFLWWLWKCPHSLWKTPPFTGRGTVWLYGHKTMTQEGNSPTSILFTRLKLLTSKSTTCLRTQHWEEMELRFKYSSVWVVPSPHSSFFHSVSLPAEVKFWACFSFSTIKESLWLNSFDQIKACASGQTSNKLQPKLLLHTLLPPWEKESMQKKNSFAETDI